jgi:Holliday junction resolvasome RuvABC endonuclease subunit
MRIEDGVIRGSYRQGDYLESSSVATSYMDKLRERIEELYEQIAKLDTRFRTNEVSADEFIEQRSRLRQSVNGLEDELHRLGG